MLPAACDRVGVDDVCGQTRSATLFVSFFFNADLYECPLGDVPHENPTIQPAADETLAPFRFRTIYCQQILWQVVDMGFKINVRSVTSLP